PVLHHSERQFMSYNPSNPLIAQSDLSILLELSSPLYLEARDQVARFAEIIESAEYVHRYQISPLSLWNAAAAGMSYDEIEKAIPEFARYPVPETVFILIREQIARYGRIRLVREEGKLVLVCEDEHTMMQIVRLKKVQPFLGNQLSPNRIEVDDKNRGLLKQALIKEKHPVEDLAGYVDGDPLPVNLRETCLSGRPFDLREYQS